MSVGILPEKAEHLEALLEKWTARDVSRGWSLGDDWLAGGMAVQVIDQMLAELHRLREKLVTERAAEQAAVLSSEESPAT